MTRENLYRQILQKQSFLCVGLDPEWEKLPQHLLDTPDPLFEFCKTIIQATKDLCVAYKPNMAFFESRGRKGWESLERILAEIPSEHFVIADAKRCDIGNTARLYAKAFFETLQVDAVTVSPYMGADSVLPFLDFPDKWVVLLALTSNAGSNDFQFNRLASGERLFEDVLIKSREWGNPDNLMYVVGATYPEQFKAVRELVPEHFLLVPGVGAQGGDLMSVAHFGFNHQAGLLVNASRSILYAGKGDQFGEKARQAALEMQEEMASLLKAELP